MLRLRTALEERLVDIGAHEHAVVGGNAEEGDEAHPDGHAQVDGAHAEERAHVDVADGEVHEPGLTVEPHQDETAGKSHEDAREVDERRRDGAELEVEYEQDDHQCHGDDDAETLGGVLLLLVGAGEGVADALRQAYFAVVDLLVQDALYLAHHVDLGQRARLVEGDVAHEERVLAADHRGAAREPDIGHLTQRYLRAIHGRDEYVAEHVGVVPQFAGVAHTDGEPLTPLDGVALAHAADGCREDALHVAHLNAVARQLLAVEVNLNVGCSRGTVVVDRGAVHLGNHSDGLLHLQAGLLNRLQVGTVDLQAHRSLQAC